MVFTEFAALVQSRWLLLRGGDKKSASADKKSAKPRKGKKALGRSRSRSRSRSRHRGPSKAPAVAVELKPAAALWVEDAAMMRESLLLTSSPEESERFAESIGSTGGYSTLDEDEEFQELLRRRSSLVEDPIERACAEAAAAAGFIQKTIQQTPGEAGKAVAKTLGSPEELVETEPEDDDEMVLMRGSGRFSGYSTFEEEEEEEEDEGDEQEEEDLVTSGVARREAVEFKSIELEEEEEVVRLVDELKLSKSDPPVVEIYERVDVDAVKLKSDEVLPVSPLLTDKQSLLEYEAEDEDEEQLEVGIACGEDMFGQSTTPSSASYFCETPSPSCSSTVASDASAPYCPGIVDEYACEIYANLRAREDRYHVTNDYFAAQPSVRPKMRAVLVDWLVEVHQRFELEPQTLFLTVNYIDRYLSCVPVRSQQLQLVGIAALLVASKFEEIYPCDMDDLLYICERSYSREELIECERSMLNTFRFELAGPTVSSFLDYFVHALEDVDAAEDKLVAHLASFLAESSLVDFAFTSAYTPSKVAAASLLASYCFVENQPPSLIWNFRRQELTGYAPDDLVPCARDLWRSMSATLDAPGNELLAVSNKYATEELSHAANLPLDDLERLLS